LGGWGYLGCVTCLLLPGNSLIFLYLAFGSEGAFGRAKLIGMNDGVLLACEACGCFGCHPVHTGRCVFKL
jgi:hypothetical protein